MQIQRWFCTEKEANDFARQLCGEKGVPHCWIRYKNESWWVFWTQEDQTESRMAALDRST